MSLQPITVQLSKFEHIEILRHEIAQREEELKNAERQIREVLWEMEKQRYLQSIHGLFQNMTPPEGAANLPQLHANRQALGEAINAMQATLSALEAETAGMSPPPPRPGLSPGLRPGAAGGAGAAGAPRRAKFDSFDDFRANRAGGAGNAQ